MTPSSIPSSASIHEIPEDVIRMVFANLPFSDAMRTGSLCKECAGAFREYARSRTPMDVPTVRVLLGRLDIRHVLSFGSACKSHLEAMRGVRFDFMASDVGSIAVIMKRAEHDDHDLVKRTEYGEFRFPLQVKLGNVFNKDGIYNIHDYRFSRWERVYHQFIILQLMNGESVLRVEQYGEILHEFTARLDRDRRRILGKSEDSLSIDY